MDGENVVPDVWEVLDKIRDFSGAHRFVSSLHRLACSSQPQPGTERLCVGGAGQDARLFGCALVIGLPAPLNRS